MNAERLMFVFESVLPTARVIRYFSCYKRKICVLLTLALKLCLNTVLTFLARQINLFFAFTRS